LLYIKYIFFTDSGCSAALGGSRSQVLATTDRSSAGADSQGPDSKPGMLAGKKPAMVQADELVELAGLKSMASGNAGK
jgi:hypothetical protein